LTRLTRSRSVGSRSNGCGGLRVRQAAGCVGSGSDGSGHPQAAGLDLVRWISIRRPRTRASAERRRAAVAGGGVRQRTRTWAPGHDLKRGRHLRAARGTAKPTGAATAAETRRRGRTTRRRGSETPARALGCYGAQA
jgi:hypothetical protein